MESKWSGTKLLLNLILLISSIGKIYYWFVHRAYLTKITYFPKYFFKRKELWTHFKRMREKLSLNCGAWSNGRQPLLEPCDINVRIFIIDWTCIDTKAFQHYLPIDFFHHSFSWNSAVLRIVAIVITSLTRT